MQIEAIRKDERYSRPTHSTHSRDSGVECTLSRSQE